MSFKTASAILRGKWLIDPTWAAAHMPLVAKMMRGETVDFGFKREELPQARLHTSRKAGAIYEVGYHTDLSRLPSGSIAMLTIAGPVTKYGDECSYGSVDHIRTISRLAASENVRGIILNIDSPGGEASGTSALAECIRNATKHKPVIGVVDDGIAASAAMWIISACTEIYVTKRTDSVGSIGAYQTIADWYGYFKEQGLNVRDVYAPQSTEKNIEYREAIKGNDELLEADLKLLVDDFQATIRTNRGGKIKSEEWVKGKMFPAKEATRIGLIDGIKTMDQVVKRMDQLIASTPSNSSILNTNKMSLVKTLTAAKATAEDFKTVIAGASIEEGGILVQASHLQAIEAAITNAEAAAATANENVTTANAAKKVAEDSLATANATIASQATRITALETENANLKKGPAAEMTSTSKEKDEPITTGKKNEKSKYHTKFDDMASGGSW